MWAKINTHYSISEDGQVRNDRNMHIRKPDLHRKGYYRIQLGNKNYFIHRLVGKAFVPNPDNKPQINHKDMNKLNNHYTNLEWVTNAENTDHSYLNGRKRAMVRVNTSYRPTLSKQQVIDILALLALKKHKLKEIADMYKVHITTISSLKQGRNLGRLNY